MGGILGDCSVCISLRRSSRYVCPVHVLCFPLSRGKYPSTTIPSNTPCVAIERRCLLTMPSLSSVSQRRRPRFWTKWSKTRKHSTSLSVCLIGSSELSLARSTMPLRSSTTSKPGSRIKANTRSWSAVRTVRIIVSRCVLRCYVGEGADWNSESRSLNVRLGYKKKDEKAGFVHMLNGTLCATERALCCLVENNQTPEVSLC
jgi:hypothetical protein